MNHKYFFKYLLSISTSLFLIYFLVRALDGLDFSKLFLFFKMPVIFLASLLYLLIKIVNTYRYNSVFKTKGFFKTLNILLYSNFVLSLIPFRLGEVVYVNFFNKYHNVAKKEGIANLILLRFFDYLAVSFFLFVSFLVLVKKGNLAVGDKLFAYPLYFSLLVFVLIIFTVLFLKKGGAYLAKFRKYVHFSEKNKKELSVAILSSLFYWFLRFNLGIYLFAMVGIDIAYFEIFFISTLLLLVSLVPVQTIAGFGIFESGWVGALLLFGIAETDLLNKIIAVHILILLYVLFFGILSRFILHTLIQNKAHHTYSEESI